MSSQELRLSEEQQIVLTSFIEGKNIFMTGPGGSGKTYLIRQLYKWCKENNKEVQVCALTGCAAILLQTQAKTLHSWAGIGLANGDPINIVSRVVNNKYKRKAWISTDVLIIDEVSMMSAKLLNILDEIGKKARNNLKPFGGIQLLFSGDFYQLPPVGNTEDPETSQYCFESPNWEDMFDVEINLEQIFRQTDESYAKALNQIRQGKMFKSTFQMLKERCQPCEEQLIKPTKLMPRKMDANSYNLQELNKLETDERIYTAKQAPFELLNLSEKDKKYLTTINSDKIVHELEFLANNIMAEKTFALRIGAQVMCIANIDVDFTNSAIVNGSCGIVKEFAPDNFPVVTFKNGVTRKIFPHIWESEHIKGIAIMQVPLILAWAITIHKSQGATLDHAEVDIGTGIFECGQTYVALSRVRDISGLYLTSFNPQKIKVNKKVQKYYERFN